jgi:glycosyltransferase involved in cell wall biosynthesis
MKVSIVDPSMFTPPYDAALIQALAARGIRVALYGRPPRLDGEFPHFPDYREFYYRISESRIIDGLSASVRRYIKAGEHITDSLRFFAASRRERPDIIHFQWLALPIIDRLGLRHLRRLCPLILTVHDSVPYNGSELHRLQTSGLASCWRCFDQLVVHTKAAREALLYAGLDEKRIHVVPHGILRAGKKQSDPGTPKRPDDTIELLFFGQIKPYKGLDVFIEALGCLRDEIKGRIRVKICGRPFIDVAPYKSRAQEIGLGDAIEFQLGFIPEDEVYDLFSSADVAVLPYRQIDGSGVLSKALDHGLAIIASDTSGFAEVLTDRETALLCGVGDAAAFARAIEAVVENGALRRRLREQSAALGRRSPSWDMIGAETADIYRRAIEGRG